MSFSPLSSVACDDAKHDVQSNRDEDCHLATGSVMATAAHTIGGVLGSRMKLRLEREALAFGAM